MSISAAQLQSQVRVSHDSITPRIFREKEIDGKDAKICDIELLKSTCQVMHQQFNIQQLYALPTLYLCVSYLSENKQRLCHLQHKLIGFYNRDEKCLQRGTDWVFKQSGLSFVFKGLKYILKSHNITQRCTNNTSKESITMHEKHVCAQKYALHLILYQTQKRPRLQCIGSDETKAPIIRIRGIKAAL